MMGFEIFERSASPLARSVCITVLKSGMIAISRAAHHLIGEPRHVELLFDPVERVIGLRPADESPNAYSLWPNTSWVGGQVLLYASSFVKFHDIDTIVSRRFTPYVADGVLCVDLRGESVEVRGNRSHTRPV